MTDPVVRRRNLIIVAAAIGVAAVAAAYVHFIARDDLLADYAVFCLKSLKQGDSYDTVTEALGHGREITSKDVPRKPSIHSIKYRNGPRQSVPVVEGDKIFLWERKGLRIYINFDSSGRLVEKQVIDSNSL